MMHFSRESIFFSTARSFCTAFAAVVGVLAGLLLVIMAFSAFSSPSILPPKSNLMVASDAQGNRELLPATAPVLLKLNIQGIIGEGDLTSEKFENLLLDSQTGMLGHNRIKGVLLHINSPGGAADDANGMYEALLNYKKKYNVPVYAFVDGLCASGGMYIACAADRIYATAPSVIGSVGVIVGPNFNLSGLMERYGIQALTVTAGKDKDALSPFRPWQPGEDASLRNITTMLYQRFISIVSQARPKLTKELLTNQYGAQIYIAEQALEYGYIDGTDSSYAQAVTALATAAQIPEETEYQVMAMAPAHPFLAELAQTKCALLRGKITHSFPIAPFLSSELSGKFLYLYQPHSN